MNQCWKIFQYQKIDISEFRKLLIIKLFVTCKDFTIYDCVICVNYGCSKWAGCTSYLKFVVVIKIRSSDRKSINNKGKEVEIEPPRLLACRRLRHLSKAPTRCQIIERKCNHACDHAQPPQRETLWILPVTDINKRRQQSNQSYAIDDQLDDSRRAFNGSIDNQKEQSTNPDRELKASQYNQLSTFRISSTISFSIWRHAFPHNFSLSLSLSLSLSASHHQYIRNEIRLLAIAMSQKPNHQN